MSGVELNVIEVNRDANRSFLTADKKLWHPSKIERGKGVGLGQSLRLEEEVRKAEESRLAAEN